MTAPAEQQAAGRDPFDPPYTAADLPRLDAMHVVVGLYPEWINSEARKAIEQSAVSGV